MAGRRRHTGPPDFVGVGAQRSGTTWWFRLLTDHPGIRGPRDRRKEQHFFDAFGGRAMTARDVAAYHERFPRRRGMLAGEWTPRYWKDFWTPPLLRRAAPDARLLVMIRDPIDRYASSTAHLERRHDVRPPAAVAVEAAERSRYGLQLRRLLRSFPAEQVLVLQYERCVEDPLGEYRRTLRFLGAPDDHRPAELTRPRGTSTAPVKQPLVPSVAEALRAALAPDVAELSRLVPDLDLSLWPHFADA